MRTDVKSEEVKNPNPPLVTNFSACALEIKISTTEIILDKTSIVAFSSVASISRGCAFENSLKVPVAITPASAPVPALIKPAFEKSINDIVCNTI